MLGEQLQQTPSNCFNRCGYISYAPFFRGGRGINPQSHIHTVCVAQTRNPKSTVKLQRLTPIKYIHIRMRTLALA